MVIDDGRLEHLEFDPPTVATADASDKEWRFDAVRRRMDGIDNAIDYWVAESADLESRMRGTVARVQALEDERARRRSQVQAIWLAVIAVVAAAALAAVIVPLAQHLLSY